MKPAGPLAKREAWAAGVDPPAFLGEVEETFERAARSVGRVEHSLTLGGLPVRLCFAGDALVTRLTRALAHLPPAPGSAGLEIRLWDTASTGVAPPPPRWNLEAYGPRGEIAGFQGGIVRAAFQVESESLLLFDAGRQRAYYWTRGPSSLPVHECAVPLRTILHWWTSLHDRQFVHGGAVGNAAGGVLLAGRGGAGKSSTTLSCLGSSLGYASDDYCLLDFSAETPVVHSAYSSAKLHGSDLRHFPALQRHVVNPEHLQQEKAVMFLHPAFSASLIASFPLRAVLLPRVIEGPATRLVPLTRKESIEALVAPTVAQLPGAGVEVIRRMARLARSVPTYAIELGSDRPQIAPRIAELLASLPS